MKGKSIFPQSKLHELHRAIMRVEISPERLLQELDPEVRGILMVTDCSPQDAVFTILARLNQLRLLDGSIPFHTVLQTARLLAGPREENEVFEDAINAFERQFPRDNAPSARLAHPRSSLPLAITLLCLTLVAAAVLGMYLKLLQERAYYEARIALLESSWREQVAHRNAEATSSESETAPLKGPADLEARSVFIDDTLFPRCTKIIELPVRLSVVTKLLNFRGSMTDTSYELELADGPFRAAILVFRGRGPDPPVTSVTYRFRSASEAGQFRELALRRFGNAGLDHQAPAGNFIWPSVGAYRLEINDLWFQIERAK